MGHAKAVLAREVDWPHLAERYCDCYSIDPGHPALPVRLMAGLQILKFTEDLSDEVLCPSCSPLWGKVHMAQFSMEIMCLPGSVLGGNQHDAV